MASVALQQPRNNSNFDLTIEWLMNHSDLISAALVEVHNRLARRQYIAYDQLMVVFDERCSRLALQQLFVRLQLYSV